MYSGRKATPEMMMNNNKTSFAQTCSRLSQFLKERRSLGDFASFQTMSTSMLDINGDKKMSSNKTMNFFPKKMEEEKNDSITEENLKSLDLFPLTSSSDTSTTTTDESTKYTTHFSRESPRSEEEPKKMTIFYAGQVIVFDDLPEDKAEEIMCLASQLSNVGSHSESQAQVQARTQIPTLPNNTLMIQPPMCMAWKASLHRFIAKRKDRVAAASPYQLHRSMSSKYDLMRQMRRKQHQQQELELKLF